ncbi:hypothetical protein AB0284_21485 [Pseudarthrobacter phenanthrenivorans]|jgi:hypothetical protein
MEALKFPSEAQPRALAELFQRIRAELTQEQADRLNTAVKSIPDD